MTVQQDAAVSEETQPEAKEAEEPKRRGLDDLPHWELVPETYVFLVKDDKDLKDIEALGYPVYFLLATHKRAKEPDYTTLMKVVSTDTAKTITPVTNDLGLAKVEEDAWFHLPRLPYTMLSDLDTFFRAVDKQLSTEAIVILTYNRKVGGQEGWGYLVPEQTNTGTACKYDHESIIPNIPDGVDVVGSVHSHPGMAAYASGTDHKDQADFDGLHITYGWQASQNNGATQFHIELQIGGQTYILDPAAIFAPKPVAEGDEESLKAQLDKVKKGTVGSQGKFPASGTGQAAKTSSTSTGTTGGTANSVTGVLPKHFPKLRKLMETSDAKGPKPWEAIYILEIFADETHCPICAEVLVLTADWENRRCLACKVFICKPEETLEEVILARMEAGIDSTPIEYGHPSNKKSSVAIWRRASAATDKAVEIIPLGDPEETKALEQPKK